MESRLVPDVFSNLEYTNKTLDVEFEKGVKMERGNMLKLSSLNKLPHISWDANDFKFYTVAVFDPDASSVIDPNRECLQFLAYNIKGSNINSGKIFADWLAPTLSKEKPRHRLVFTVYEQQGEIYPIEKPLTNECLSRCDFHLQDFRRRYNLSNPIAVNYFESEFDENQPLPGTGLLTTIVEGIQTGAHYLGEKVQAGLETVKEGMHELRERVHDKKEELRQLAEEKKEQIKEGAQDIQQQFQEKKEDIRQDFQEKKAEVREQPNIDIRQGTAPIENFEAFPPVQKRIEIFEKGTVSNQQGNLPTGSYESLSTGQTTISTQPVFVTTTTTQPVLVENQPSLLVNVAEGIKSGVQSLGENLQAGYEVLKENLQAGAGVIKEKVQEGAVVIKENLQAGAGILKENVQAGYEVAKEKVAHGIENLKEGAINVKEDLKAGAQKVGENVQAGLVVAKENIKAGAQKVGETLTPVTTTEVTTTTSYKPTFVAPSSSISSSGSFVNENDQINRLENLASQNEDLSFLNEGASTTSEQFKSEKFTPMEGDIKIATTDQPSTEFNQPTTGFNQPSTMDQPIGLNYNPTDPMNKFNQPTSLLPGMSPSNTTEFKPESKY
jgi:gas vesicle protein